MILSGGAILCRLIVYKILANKSTSNRLLKWQKVTLRVEREIHWEIIATKKSKYTRNRKATWKLDIDVTFLTLIIS